MKCIPDCKPKTNSIESCITKRNSPSLFIMKKKRDVPFCNALVTYNYVQQAFLYKICRDLCKRRLTVAIATQQQNPNKIGFPPFLTNLIRSVLRPMALIAITIKNLLSCFIMAKLCWATTRGAPEQ